jgi:hypothetical protein
MVEGGGDEYSENSGKAAQKKTFLSYNTPSSKKVVQKPVPKNVPSPIPQVQQRNIGNPKPIVQARPQAQQKPQQPAKPISQIKPQPQNQQKIVLPKPTNKVLSSAQAPKQQSTSKPIVQTKLQTAQSKPSQSQTQKSPVMDMKSPSEKKDLKKDEKTTEKKEKEGKPISDDKERAKGKNDVSDIKPYYKAKPMIVPQKTDKDKNVKKPTPVTTPIQNVDYKYAGRESLYELLRRTLPKEFIPTDRMGPILGIIFVAIILLGMLQYATSGALDFMNADPETIMNNSIKIGVPFKFLVFDAVETEQFPLKWGWLILDLMVYIFLAYVIDVGINYAHSQAKSLTKDERKKRPKILKVEQKKGTLAEKITEKIFEDD